MTSSANDRRGFTLTELILVVFVVALLSAVLWPVLSGSLPGMQLDRSTEDLYAVLTRMRQEAVLTARTHELYLESSEGRYLVYVEADPVGEPGVFHPAAGALRGPFYVAERVSLTGADSAAPVRMKPDGTSDGATLTLTHESGASRTVTVDAKTGLPKVSE